MSLRVTDDFDQCTTATPTRLASAPTRLAAVLAAGQVELEATNGFFGKADPLQPFRNAVTEWDDKKVEKKIQAAVAKLKPDQTKALADEFVRKEAEAWTKLNQASAQKDSYKERLARAKALEAVLRAQLGLATLYTYDPNKSVTALPLRPDMPAKYNYHRWSSYAIKKGTDAWRDYRTLRDHWKKAHNLVDDLENERK